MEQTKTKTKNRKQTIYKTNLLNKIIKKAKQTNSQ